VLVAGALQDAFWAVLLIVVIGGAVVAVFTVMGTGKLYDQIGRGGLWLREEDEHPPAPGAPPVARETARERDEEIRQLLQARNDRRARRGEPPADIESELRRLTGAQVDPALRAEIRQLVIARNQRRARRGEEPLDVDAEIERQIRELS
jgi:hypothetical protein